MAYLDHAATTPMVPEALTALEANLRITGNPSSLHAHGRAARRVVEESRESLAASLGCSPTEVVFTAGGTEADNLAVKGLAWARRSERGSRTRILVSAVEHHAVLDPTIWLAEQQGFTVELLPVDRLGRVDLDYARALLLTNSDSIAVLSVMWANNEVGTVQPVEALAQAAREAGVPFHCDAVQALGSLPIDFAASGVDAATISGHKVGGPRATGALLLRRGLTPTPVLHGGGQERGVRSGTLDAPGAAGLAAAVAVAVANQERHAARVSALRHDLVARVRVAVPEAVLNGDPDELSGACDPGVGLGGVQSGYRRLPGNAHFSFPGCEGDALLMLLDAQGVECSTGSACQAGVARPSHVLLAMGADTARAQGTLRFSLGHNSTPADVDALLDVLPAAVARARRAGELPRLGAARRLAHTLGMESFAPQLLSPQLLSPQSLSPQSLLPES